LHRRIRVTRWRLASFLAILTAGATVAVVFAYFGALGSANTDNTNSPKTVTLASTWSFVNVNGCTTTNCASGGVTSTALSPGSGTAYVDFAIQNTGTSTVTLNGVTASIPTDSSGDIFNVASGTPTALTGCLGSWFNILSNATNLPQAVPAGEYYVGNSTPASTNPPSGSSNAYATITMPANTTTNQSACASSSTNPVQIEVSLSAS
jgi:hypothetical protein